MPTVSRTRSAPLLRLLLKPGILAAALLLPLPALAQRAPMPMKLFASSAEIQQLITKARAVPKRPGVSTVEPMVTVEPFRAQLEYRTSVTPAAVHHNVAGIGYVIEGSCDLVTGGTLTGQKPAAPDAKNLSGTGIAGGTTQHLQKGDWFMIPAEYPHQFQNIHGELIFMGMHLPMPGAPK